MLPGNIAAAFALQVRGEPLPACPVFIMLLAIINEKNWLVGISRSFLLSLLRELGTTTVSSGRFLLRSTPRVIRFPDERVHRYVHFPQPAFLAFTPRFQFLQHSVISVPA